MPNIRDEVKSLRKPKSVYPLFQEMSERFSPRYFSGENITGEEMNTIFEAARWAPSARNWQPWFFYWTRKTSIIFQSILKCLPENNDWAKTASALIVACFINNNENGENEYAKYDLGAAVLALILQAQHLGYYSRQIGLFDREQISQVVGAKEHEYPFVIIALGKLGDYASANEVLVEKDLTQPERKTELEQEL